MQLIAVAHELDWAFFWKDSERHSKAVKALEEVKDITKWREKVK